LSYLKPLPESELRPYQYIFDLSKEQMGYTPNSLRDMAHIPALLSNFSFLSGILLTDNRKVNFLSLVKLTINNIIWSLKFRKKKNRVPLYLRHLVAFASSNASGCRYCQAHTLNEAKHNGISNEQLNEIWDYKNSTLFTAKEKAAIDFGFAAGSHPNAVEKHHINTLSNYFSDAQIVELNAITALFGFLNRWNDSFATKLEEEPKNFMEETISKNNWHIGRHK